MGIKVKAMVDKEKNKVVFAESDEDFIDVLFSFMTMPMGTIVSLTMNLPKMAIGCINNLYSSVQNLHVKYFRTEGCQRMLLYPRNGAPAQCRLLEIKTEEFFDPHCYFYCGGPECFKSSPRVLSHYQTYCACRRYMNLQLFQLGPKMKSSYEDSHPRNAGVFLKGLNRLVISDDLKLMPPTASSTLSFLSDLGVMGATTASQLELREFYIGKDEVIHLLKSSFVSKEALTQTLLRKNEPYKENLVKGGFSSSFKSNVRLGEAENGKISVKLFVSKSKKIVCFAEAGEDFVDLVFSFLTIPLGHVLKELEAATVIDGCVDNLYKCIDDLDVEFFKSGKEKEMLLNPKIPPKFGYDNQLIGVEEVSTSDISFDGISSAITVKDPKIPAHKEDKSNGGFMTGPAMFTVTDDLNVIPISSVSGLNILNTLDVPLSDVQECVVHVGKKEAVCMLVASFVSGSALTKTFLQK